MHAFCCSLIHFCARLREGLSFFWTLCLNIPSWHGLCLSCMVIASAAILLLCCLPLLRSGYLTFYCNFYRETGNWRFTGSEIRGNPLSGREGKSWFGVVWCGVVWCGLGGGEEEEGEERGAHPGLLPPAVGECRKRTSTTTVTSSERHVRFDGSTMVGIVDVVGRFSHTVTARRASTLRYHCEMRDLTPS